MMLNLSTDPAERDRIAHRVGGIDEVLGYAPRTVEMYRLENPEPVVRAGTRTREEPDG